MVKTRKLKKLKNTALKVFMMILLILAISFVINSPASADQIYHTTDVNIGTDDNSILNIGINSDGGGNGLSSTLQIVLVLTIIALCPSILIMLTCFTRIVIVLHFTRSALNTQTAPPNQVIIGLALFLTFFVMAPVFGEVYNGALVPLTNGQISVEEAYDTGIEPIREFMFNQVDDKDLDAMSAIAGFDSISSKDEIPTYVLIPAFILTELRIAFWIGFLIYIPFLVIDMVVASTLMSMGMMMLPPTTISMPFKILLFVLADGWNLIIVNLVSTIIV